MMDRWDMGREGGGGERERGRWRGERTQEHEGHGIPWRACRSVWLGWAGMVKDNVLCTD